jgi:hypothetical protein
MFLSGVGDFIQHAGQQMADNFRQNITGMANPNPSNPNSNWFGQMGNQFRQNFVNRTGIAALAPQSPLQTGATGFSKYAPLNDDPAFAGKE